MLHLFLLSSNNDLLHQYHANGVNLLAHNSITSEHDKLKYTLKAVYYLTSIYFFLFYS